MYPPVSPAGAPSEAQAVPPGYSGARSSRMLSTGQGTESPQPHTHELEGVGRRFCATPQLLRLALNGSDLAWCTALALHIGGTRIAYFV